LIDTDQIKDFYHRGIEQAVAGGSSALYLHADTDEVYARHVLAERKVVNPKTGAITWETKGANHLFDASLLGISLAQPQWILGGVNLLRSPVTAKSESEREQLAQKKVRSTIARSKWMQR